MTRGIPIVYVSAKRQAKEVEGGAVMYGRFAVKNFERFRQRKVAYAVR